MNPVFSVSDFVAVLNQTLDYAFPTVTIVGELSNFRVSKGKWVYFDLKDESSSIRFFGTVFMLPGPLEEGMMVKVVGSPRLHQTFGFSITVKSITPVGEGSIKKAAELLQAKLTAEGLFATERKRSLPYPPTRIGLVTSGESAAYKDFLKILSSRWGGIEIVHADVQVQGESAVQQIVSALNELNTTQELDVIVVTRGGGSADDLQAFSSEQVVRAIAASRIPTLVAIGHEVDTSLSELAADRRASTPSNAAELLVPDRDTTILQFRTELKRSRDRITQLFAQETDINKGLLAEANNRLLQEIKKQQNYANNALQVLHGFDPRRILSRGYALVRSGNSPVKSVTQLKLNDIISIRLVDGSVAAKIGSVKPVE